LVNYITEITFAQYTRAHKYMQNKCFTHVIISTKCSTVHKGRCGVSAGKTV